jgi:hypothetical protein
MSNDSKLHRFARQIADKLARGASLPFSDEMEAYIETEPERLLDALDAMAQQLALDTDEAERLATAYLLLISMQLQSLRYALERNLEWAKQLKESFEGRVVSLVGSGTLHGTAMSLIAGAMREAELTPGAAFVAANQAMLEAEAPALDAATDLGSVLQQLADQAGDDAFGLLDALRDALHAVPVEPLAAIAAQMASSSSPLLREAAALLVLHPEKEVRRSVALTLLGTAENVDPRTMRRLILIRGWLPEEERHLIDQVVRAARTKGISCAGWEPRTIKRLTASAIDGSGAQMVVMLSPDGKRQRVSTILLKEGKGVADAWSRGAMSKREVGEMIGEMEATMHTRTVSRPYVDRILCHHLGAGLELGTLAAAGLVDVAESVGAADWRPARLDWRDVLDELLADLPPDALRPVDVEAAIEQSMETAEVSGLLPSWFESDQEVDTLLREAATQGHENLIPVVLERVIAPRKEKWIERLVWVALWMREGEASEHLRWSDFAVLARELLAGRALDTVPLLQEISAQTVAAWDA